MEWQPIETAPKYKDILLIGSGGTQVVGYWDDDDGWVCDYRGKGNFNYVDATHWMPLPNPPSAQS